MLDEHASLDVPCAEIKAQDVGAAIPAIASIELSAFESTRYLEDQHNSKYDVKNPLERRNALLDLLIRDRMGGGQHDCRV